MLDSPLGFARETREPFVDSLEANMSVIATSLSKVLPKPKDSGNYEVFQNPSQRAGPRIVEEGALVQNQIVIKVGEQST